MLTFIPIEQHPTASRTIVNILRDSIQLGAIIHDRRVLPWYLYATPDGGATLLFRGQYPSRQAAEQAGRELFSAYPPTGELRLP